MSKPLHLFQGFGIELEYMIVDKSTLQVSPIADELLKSMTGEYTGDYGNGMVTWSNELVLHVIELKCTKPESDLVKLEKAFHANVKQINAQLQKWNAMLLPTAAHPEMNPLVHTKLWPHDNNEIYSIYNKIFDCKGHGWSNLQSTHLNLPFVGDEEFGRLHAAIRVVLPLLPALCASSTMLDGKLTDHVDARMWYYKNNQKAIPSITGRVIPEAVFTESDYDKDIYQKIAQDIVPYNEGSILDPVWVNSRGAMARFDRGSIEIRVMDIQESVKMDMAIQRFVIDLLKWLVSRPCEDQKSVETGRLADVLDATITHGMHAEVDYDEWLAIFGARGKCTIGDVFRRLPVTNPVVDVILDAGNLSSRIRKALTGRSMIDVYRDLSLCLQSNKMFIP